MAFGCSTEHALRVYCHSVQRGWGVNGAVASDGPLCLPSRAQQAGCDCLRNITANHYRHSRANRGRSNHQQTRTGARRKCCHHSPTAALERLSDATGSREWPPVLDGAELAVSDDPKKLAAVINEIFASVRSLREAQEKTYPQPRGDEVAAKDIIAEKLLALARR